MQLKEPTLVAAKDLDAACVGVDQQVLLQSRYLTVGGAKAAERFSSFSNPAE